jgi:hypothetical protein
MQWPGAHPNPKGHSRTQEIPVKILLLESLKNLK